MSPTSPNPRKLARLFGYGVGDFGLNIYWQTVSMFLIYWYTQVAGIDPRIAGLIFFLGMTWDAISDPVVASLAERVQTRMGTYRPFLLFGSLITAIAFIILFWVPPFEGTTKIAFLIFTCLLFRTSYTVVAIPYSAMASRITYDSTERAEYSGARMFFAFFALVLVSMYLWPLVNHFTESSGSDRFAFQYTAAIGGVVATLALWLCFTMTREQPLPSKTVQSEKIWKGILQNIRSNRALQVLLFVILLNTAATSALGITLIYYIQAHGELFAAKEVLFTSFAIATWLMVPVWTYFIRIWGRKKIWIVTSLLHAAIALHMYFGEPVIFYGVPVHIIFFMALGGSHAIIFWALIPDCVEFGQVDSGYRGVYGSVLITQKMAGGLMGLVIGFVLAALGISKDTSITPEHAESLSNFIAICPAIFVLISIIPIILLPMNRAAHDQIIGQLE